MTSPWRTTTWAAKHLCFTDDGSPTGVPDLKRFHKWLTKYVQPEHIKHVGRSLRVHIEAIESRPELCR